MYMPFTNDEGSGCGELDSLDSVRLLCRRDVSSWPLRPGGEGRCIQRAGNRGNESKQCGHAGSGCAVGNEPSQSVFATISSCGTLVCCMLDPLFTAGYSESSLCVHVSHVCMCPNGGTAPCVPVSQTRLNRSACSVTWSMWRARGSSTRAT